MAIRKRRSSEERRLIRALGQVVALAVRYRLARVQTEALREINRIAATAIDANSRARGVK